MGLKTHIKNFVMNSSVLREFYFSIRSSKLKRELQRKYGGMSRKGIFENIYSNFTWGGGGTEKYYSGPGSHTDSYVTPYCELIKTFLTEHPDIKHVIDFGCGDFNVASKFISDNIDYTGVDIVEKMIASHQKNFASEHVNFLCRDIVDDDLPDGDMCLIRQVLQHLSNDEVSRVLAKLKKYRYALITEQVTPKAYASAINADILTGNYIRVNFLSGVYLDEAPFSVPCEVILRIPYDEKCTSELVTYLVKN